MSEQLRSERIEIEGQDGLKLRQLIWADARDYFELIDYDRAHLSQYGDDTAKKYDTYGKVLDSIVNPKNPSKLRFGIWQDETMVGSIGLTPEAERNAEIGYWIGKEHIGHGHATEAVKTLTQFAFDQLGLELLYAKVAADNKPSDRVLKKSGYRLAVIDTQKRINIYERKNNPARDSAVKVT